ncbi:hypothetical protein [Gemmatimonas sp. UBA7669]|uniref:hypothetical protein n=1 Tax=Gemmatimonas sp. UBA7669 TaxID=1946568 RepID=UPI0025C25BB0|nr:hypothetical protein [Gemmatimonas sp. UBA7669]
MTTTSFHLDAERLAAFDHEPFTDEELAHLSACASCRAEQEAIARLVDLAHGVLVAEAAAEDAGHTAPRLVSWEQIATGLARDEGARDVQTTAATASPAALRMASAARLPDERSRTAGSRSVLFRRLQFAAAAALLLATGATFGRLTGPSSNGLSLARASQEAVAESLGLSAGMLPVANTNGFTSVEEASTVLERAQRDYERASLWLAANDTVQHDSEVFRARLAALDQMMAASRAALRDAPQDPVLNQYYLAAYTAREATLQQLMGTLPVNKTIERY